MSYVTPRISPTGTMVAFIQARSTSQRFPRKIFAPLAGKPMLQWICEAAADIPGVDRFAVLTSNDGSDDAVADWCAENGVTCHRGALADVLDRFRDAIDAEGLDDTDSVMRLTADCPLLDPAVCGMTAALYRARQVEHASNVKPSTWPDGLDCEIFSVNALRAAAREATAAFDREHVGPFIWRNRSRFPAAVLDCPVGPNRAHRWTVDTPEDLAFLERLLAAVPHKTRRPGFAEFMAALAADPGLDAESRRGGTAVASSQAIAKAGDRSDPFARSAEFLSRSLDTIPLASQTYSKAHTQLPRGNAPLFLSHGHGARVYDIDGNEYVDLINGLLPVVLGYCDPDVDTAVRDQLHSGTSFSLATELETRLAEKLVELIPCAEMVRYGKAGSDATSAAIRAARSVTGRDIVVACGYHGWHDWYIGATTRASGVPESVRGLTKKFAYNDLAGLDAILAEDEGKIAAIIMEPMNAVDPEPGFLEGIRERATRHGIVLVFDEIITGFRYDLGGAQKLFGVTPDLACIGKGMANGMPISAVVGKESIMRCFEEIFFSGTFGGEAASIAASLATIDKLERTNGVAKLWETGATLAKGLTELIGRYNLGDILAVKGKDPWRLLGITPTASASAFAIKTKLMVEMYRRGVLMGASHNVSCAMTQNDIAGILNAYDGALQSIADALSDNERNLEESLPCPPVTPVFAVR